MSSAQPRARRRLGLWIGIGASALALAFAVAATVLIRGWPHVAVRLAPTPELVPWILGLVAAETRGDQARVATERITELGGGAAAIAIDALEGPRPRRRGAWRLLAQYGMLTSDQRAAVRPLLREDLAVVTGDDLDDVRRAYAGWEGRFALEYLSRAQRDDGSWPAASGELAPGHVPGEVGVTALVLAAFRQSGVGTTLSTHSPLVVKASSWLAARQRSDGTFTDDARDDALVLRVVGMAWMDGGDLEACRVPAQARWKVDRGRQAVSDDPVLHAHRAFLSYWGMGGFAPLARLDDLAERAWRAHPRFSRAGEAAALLAFVHAVEDAPDLPALDAALVEAIASRGVDDWRPWPRHLLMVAAGRRSIPPAWPWLQESREVLRASQRAGDPLTDGSWDPTSGDERDRVMETACHALALDAYDAYTGIQE